MKVEFESSFEFHLPFRGNIEIFTIFLNEGAIVSIELMDAVDEDIFFPCLCTLSRVLIIVEEIGG